MTGKMFADGLHAPFLHARHIGMRQIGHDLGVGVEGTVADHGADAAIQIQHWGKS